MNKVATYSNWIYYETLDGVRLEEGELLKVKFPNGRVVNSVVHLEHRTAPGDMSGPVPDIESFITVQVLGISVLVSLRKHANELLCERVK